MAQDRRTLLVAGAAALVAAPALAGTAPASSSRLSRRQVTARDGQVYRIDLSIPSGPAPAGGFPVLFVLDGNAWFSVASAVAESRRDDLGRIVVVGIGSPGEARFDTRRLNDLTPTAPAEPLSFGQQGLPVGGADAFADFLIGAASAEVAGQVKLAPHGRTLFGHSLGGLFVLHLLFTRPTAFDAYGAASPSIWWNKDRLLAEEAAARFAVPPPRLLLTAGGLEDRLSPSDRTYLKDRYDADPKAFAGKSFDQALADYLRMVVGHRMAANAQEMAARLSARGLPATYAELADEDHPSSAVVALNRALRFALQPEG